METHLTRGPSVRRWIAAMLIIVGFLAGALFATVANSPGRVAPTATAPAPGATAVSNVVPSDSGDVGSFAFGYVEFDWNPKAPGGVPGFDSWPPGSPPRR